MKNKNKTRNAVKIKIYFTAPSITGRKFSRFCFTLRQVHHTNTVSNKTTNYTSETLIYATNTVLTLKWENLNTEIETTWTRSKLCATI